MEQKSETENGLCAHRKWRRTATASFAALMDRALGDQLYGDQQQHDEIRKRVVDYIESKRDDFEPFMEDEEKFENYCRRMREDGTWGGNQEIYAAARLFTMYIVIHQEHTRVVIECDTQSQLEWSISRTTAATTTTASAVSATQTPMRLRLRLCSTLTGSVPRNLLRCANSDLCLLFAWKADRVESPWHADPKRWKAYASTSSKSSASSAATGHPIAATSSGASEEDGVDSLADRLAATGLGASGASPKAVVLSKKAQRMLKKQQRTKKAGQVRFTTN
ncbi:hypothetical protein PINS_up023892 [Pythium insidiosum]|nr:hypothetical protein PINS_up023892 [Pythium insidiosum]